jgi:hypothetical protein
VKARVSTLRTVIACVVVGAGTVLSAGVVLSTAAPASASSSFSFPTPTELPGIDFVSCTGPTDCTAGYGQYSGLGTETKGTWGDQIPLSGTGPLDVADVSCTSTGNCVAIGEDSDIEAGYWTETNGVWDTSITAFPEPANGTFGFVGAGNDESPAVSCTSPGYCTVIGGLSVSGEPTASGPGIEVETNGVWGTPFLEPAGDPVGLTPDDVTNFLNSVSCSDANDCVAVGDGEAYGEGPWALVASETDGSWSEAIPEPLGIITNFNSVSCASAGNCTAVGYSGPGAGPTSTAAYQIESNGSWGPETDFSGTVPSGESYSTDTWEFNGVSCPSVGDCVAVGGDWNSDPTYAVESGGTFGPVIAAALDPGDTDGFKGVSCVSTADCTAVGTQDGAIYSDSISNTPSITETDNGANAGQTLTLTAKVTGTASSAPSAGVTWSVQDSQCTSTPGPVVSGNVATYTCSINDIGTGTYNTSVTYDGDVNYAQVTGTDDVTVSAEAAPTTSVVTPSKGATLSGTGTTLDASASNASSVEFLLFGGSYGLNAQTLCTATQSSSGWACSWNTTTVPNGNYTLVSYASGPGGNTASTGVGVTVKNPLPTTSVVVPSKGTALSGSSVTLDASASNATSVAFVLFGGSYGYNGQLLGTATSSAYGWIYSWNSTSVPDGSYTLTSLATNSVGSTFSAGVAVTVKN